MIVQGREHQEEKDTFLPVEFRDLAPAQLESLHQLAITKIKEWVVGGRLLEHPKLLPILHAWHDFEKGEDCKQFIKEMTITDRGLIIFLVAAFDQAITEAMTKHEKNPAWKVHFEKIEKLIPASSLVSHAKTLFEDNYFEKLREREQLALMIFLDLAKVETKKTIPMTTAS